MSDPRPIPEPRDPPGDGPLPPKGRAPPKPPASDATGLSAETGVALPIVFGTIRVPGNVIERYAYTFESGSTLERAPSTTYVLGDIRRNAENLFIAATNGTTGTGDGPSGTSSGQVDGTVTWDYIKYGYRHFVAIAYCEGQIFGALRGWQDKNVLSPYTAIAHDWSSIGIELKLGTPAGGRPSSPAWFIPQTDVYGNTAILYAKMSTGSNADLPKMDLEIQGIFADNTNVDVNPADIANLLLMDVRRGAAWPSGMVDAVSIGIASAASWKNYCKAAGFLVSWNIDSQQSAKALIRQLLAATNTNAVMTNRLDGLGWMIKFVPLGTDPITANGATFTPNLTPAYALTPDDFLDPVQIDTIQPTETFNSVPIEYIDRSTDYQRIVRDDPAMDDVDVRGLVRMNALGLPMVMSPDAAVQLSRIYAQRSLNVANTIRMRVGYRFLLAEPTDLVTATDGLIGISAQAARITVFEEDQASGTITLEAEDFPAAVGAAATYTQESPVGFKPTVSTALDVLQVLPRQMPPKTVSDSSSTRGAAVDNIWPNFNSETNPPDGVDTSRPEWAGRLNVGVGTAYNGAWVRQLTAALNGKQSLGAPVTANGGTGGNEPTFQSQLALEIACAPGDIFYLEAQAKWITTTGAQACGVVIYFLNGARQVLASGGFSANTGGVAAGWTRVSGQATAPAATVSVRFICFMNSDLGAATAQFDTIYARRSIDLKLLAVEPWAASRIMAMCQVVVNAAGTTVVYQTGMNSGFDVGTTPAFVQVGVEPAKRLRLTLAALPNSQSLSNMKHFVFAQRMPNGITGINPSIELWLHGWNLGSNQFDFFAANIDWTSGVQTIQHPLAWANIDSVNGSLWDIAVLLHAPSPFKFF